MLLFFIIIGSVTVIWSGPFLWMIIASFKPQTFGGLDMASLAPNFKPTLDNYRMALMSAEFGTLYINTIIVTFGTLSVQLVTVVLAAYAFARLEFRFKTLIFYMFLMQLMIVPPILIVPNLKTIVSIGLDDTLVAVMAPYFASAFGIFLMRQTFKSIPRDFEDAAVIDGCNWFQVLRYVLLPLAKPALVAFSIVSIVAHWNEFLWPLMVIDSPDKMTLTVGLASFTRAAEGAADWGLIAAGTMIVMFPLIVAFVLFQRQFVSSFMFSGIK
ncbi:MAG TPA: carbohydrate ABC transporter permease [Gammaproteobacteria bacterium]|nr:carbohydrate ABC transporter permease [Gammaproteobacteria bacterium]